MASSDDDSADIAAALELELEGGSSEPEQGDGGVSNKRRRVEEGKANGADPDADAARPRPRPPPVAAATASTGACAHPATMGGICVVCGLHVSSAVTASHESEAEERQRRRRQEKQERQQGAAAAGAASAATTATAAPATTAATGPDQQASEDQVALRYIHAGLRVSAAEAARLREASDAASKAARRLHLVLDLDHTLLNSTRLDEVPKDTCGEAMDAMIAAEDAEAEKGGEEGPGSGKEATGKPFPFQSLRAFPPHPSRSLFYLPAIGLWTKLRPGTRAFLRKSSEKYELAVYTHGDRAYAAAMARLLDPTGELFGGRVISQGDSTRAHHKSLDVVLGSDSTTVVLDDTRAVWPQHEGNLLLVDRYIFFPACAGRFHSLAAAPLAAGGSGSGGSGSGGSGSGGSGSGGSGSGGSGETASATPERPLSWLEKNRDEDPDTGMLSVAARVLEAVHSSYFKELDEEDKRKKEASGGGSTGETTTKTKTPPPPTTTADVRTHLRALRSSILRGCVLVLSGLAPMGTPLEAVPAARTARALGAVVEEKLVPGRTTHVVAAADGTAKVKSARAHNLSTACAAAAEAAAAGAASTATTASPLISCVSPEWLAACLFGWERKDEALFPVVAASGVGGVPRAATRTDAEDLAAAAAAAGRVGG